MNTICPQPSMTARRVNLASYQQRKPEITSLSVLVADDEEHLGKLITRMLRVLGHGVVGLARNGVEVVEMARVKHPNLLILDIDMPKLDGIEAAKQILSEGSVPILISTGRTDEETLDRIRSVKVQGYLVKPFSQSQLKTAIQVALAQHAALVESEIRIADLTAQLTAIKAIDAAVTKLISRFSISRDEALRNLHGLAQEHDYSLAEAAEQLLKT